MKRVSAATAVLLFGLAPVVGSACEISDKSAAVPDRLASAPAPAASRVPAPAMSTALTAKAAKPAADNTKQVATDRKLAVAAGN